ncbi:hypothetical protein, partial [Pedobacter sp. UBA5917]|uniref:hypothetical protein n=1 Tax=Pedobacter sp. UBA5917 TaxID=1947061 RepID=UPI0025CE80E7
MKIKAVFFLFIFMLNTLVGFGCSISMENGGHEHGHKHHHHEHQHAAFKVLFPQSVKTQLTGQEDSCCKTLVNDFLVQGKILPDYAKQNLKAPALVPLGFSFSFIPETEIIIADQQ